MNKLPTDAAFEALRALLAGAGRGDNWCAESPAIERLREALMETPQTAQHLDLAVMLRQVLRHLHWLLPSIGSPTVRIFHDRLAGFTQWDRVGLQAVRNTSGWLVSARPWRPNWLPALDDGVDAYAASEQLRRELNAADCEADPFLAVVNKPTYRSKGQRAAVRAALTTPASGTLAVALPTGEGKSLIFQLIQRIGFVDTNPADPRGVTLVIVPTVALAVNHEKEAMGTCGLPSPLAYQGGDDVRGNIIAERIVEGTQGLCFASPEAACGRLRTALRKAAEAGHLRALVIDEAHLVDQWGTGFRTEFQELSGLRQELLELSPAGRELRTILLSATLPESTLDTLRGLFGGGAFHQIAAVQLRPEPDYWVAARSTEKVRRDRVLEALHHIPRPAVLYVTKVKEAEYWYAHLKRAGFGRIRKLHGKTSSAEREEIVEAWRDGKIDIVVGTSAFGLGIDYRHARSVVHACVPETLDRFYQEVGRAGRDGRAALSIIIPSNRDLGVADSVNATRMISVERGYTRWSTMFARKVMNDPRRLAVRVDGRPGNDERDLDMSGERNTDWNLRTLTLMARAGLIRLRGALHRPSDSEGEWLEVEIIDDGHLDLEVWRQHVEPIRQSSWSALRRNLELMREFLEETRCPSEVFQELYGIDRFSIRCSRCRWCRHSDRCHDASSTNIEPISPWKLPLTPLLEQLLGPDNRLLVIYEAERLAYAASHHLGRSLCRLRQLGLAKLLILGPQAFDMRTVLESVSSVPFFVSSVKSLAMSRLPKGPELVMVGPGQHLSDQNLASRIDNSRIFLVPREQRAPDGRILREVFGGRTLTLDELNARVSL